MELLNGAPWPRPSGSLVFWGSEYTVPSACISLNSWQVQSLSSAIAPKTHESAVATVFLKPQNTKLDRSFQSPSLHPHTPLKSQHPSFHVPVSGIGEGSITGSPRAVGRIRPCWKARCQPKQGRSFIILKLILYYLPKPYSNY